MQGGRALTNCRIWIGCTIALSTVVLYPPRLHCQSDAVPWSIKQLVEYHQGIHKDLEVQDVYKMFYQAAFGVEHLLSDSAGVTTYLLSELSSVDSVQTNEPLLERISITPAPVRVNLRPFNALNLDPAVLVKVMFQSARETMPDTLMFYRMWNEFSALVRYGLLRFPVDTIRVWDTMLEAGVPGPMHHSAGYTAANHPAYRVVRRSLFESAFGRKPEQ